MEIAKEMNDLVRAHRATPDGMVFYDSIESVRSDMGLLGYMSLVERAWREMELAGALCIENRPILYLKVFDQPSSPLERIKLQRLFWNQGIANILVLADSEIVYIYSGLAKPSDESSDKDNEEALVEKLNYVDYAQRIHSFHHNLATGHYYSIHKDYFEPTESVDAWLLGNLRSLRETLITGDEAMEIQKAHAFIGRVLFVCYLLDRGIISVGEPSKMATGTMLLADLLEGQTHEFQINVLYGLFRDLGDDHRFGQ